MNERKFQVGIFAVLTEEWSHEEQGYIESISYLIHDWCDESGVEYWKKDGHVLVERKDFTLSSEITREEVVSGMVEGLHAKATALKAETQKELTKIEQKINSLLQLAYTPAEPKGEFASRRDNGDAEDVIPF